MRKKHIKKSFALLLSIAISLIGPSFARADDGWTVNYIGTGKTDRDIYYAEKTAEKSYSGTYSMHISYSGRAMNNTYLEIEGALPEELDEGNYNVRFYINGTFGSTTKVMIGDSEYLLSNAVWQVEEIPETEAPSGEGGWKCYFAEIRLPHIYGGKIKVVFQTAAAYLDNIELCEARSGENLLTGGDFENEETQEEVLYDPEKYIPSQVISSYTTEGGIALSWRNPDTDTIKKVTLCDITDNRTVLSDGFSLKARAINEYVTDTLVADRQYQYKLVFEYSDVPCTEYFVACTAAKASRNNTYTLGAWNISSNHSNTEHGYGAFKAYIDTAQGCESTSSLKIESNAKEVLANTYLSIGTAIAPVLGEDYQLSFDMKNINCDRNIKAHMNWVYFDAEYTENNAFLKGTKVCDDWTHIVVKKTALNITDGFTPNNVTFIVDYATDGIWIDNVELYMLDEDGNTVGENLIADGTFENIASSKTSVIKDPSAEGSYGGAILSWKTVGDISDVNLYQKVGDNWKYLGRICGDKNSIALENLGYEKECTFKIAPVNTYGFEGTEKEVTVTTLAPDYIVGDASAESAGNGYYKVSISAKNNSIDGGMPIEMLICIYKQGALYKAESAAKVIKKTPANEKPTDIIKQISIPTDADRTICIFSLNSISDGVILRECQKIELRQ